MSTPTTDDVKQEVLYAYASGATPKRCADAAGLPVGYVLSVIRRSGVPTAADVETALRRHSDSAYAQRSRSIPVRVIAVRLCMAGMPMSDVAGMFDVTESTVAHWARRAGYRRPLRRQREVLADCLAERGLTRRQVVDLQETRMVLGGYAERVLADLPPAFTFRTNGMGRPKRYWLRADVDAALRDVHAAAVEKLRALVA